MAESKKKISIKPFKTRLALDRKGAEATWENLASAIDEIHLRNSSQLSFQELYNHAYNLVVQNYATLLYDGVSYKITQHLHRTLSLLLDKDYSVLSDVQFLQDLALAYKEHCVTMIMVRDILMYMDRSTSNSTYQHHHHHHQYSHSSSNPSSSNNNTSVTSYHRKSIYDLGQHLFRIHLWEHPKIHSRAVEIILQEIHLDRSNSINSYHAISNALDVNSTKNTNNNNNNNSSNNTTLAQRTLLLKDVLNMLRQIGDADNSNIYERDFEEIFLGTTQEYYRNESSSFLQSSSASASITTTTTTTTTNAFVSTTPSATEYVTKMTNRLQEEKDRARDLALPLSTETPLTNILQTELIERHALHLIHMDQGFMYLLKQDSKINENNANTYNIIQDTAIIHTNENTKSMMEPTWNSNAKLDDLRKMYDLFVRVPSSINHLRDAFSAQIKSDGKILMDDQEKGVCDPPSFIRGVLQMRQRYKEIASYSFRDEKKATEKLKESFEDFLNMDARAASCLAVYADELLRNGLKGATEVEVDRELQQVIVIFRYISDKDVFESFYKQYLAKRLLTGKSVSEEAERAMVSQLKAECGYQFTSKLEGMFNDIRISRDTRESYATFKRTSSDTAFVTAAASLPIASSTDKTTSEVVDIEVDVLTTGYWPSQNVPMCNLPIPINNAIQHFSEFYLQKHTGRKLSWQTSTGTAEIRSTFKLNPLRRYDLIVSTYQMCILMLFNDRNTWTLAEIRSETNIPDMELRRHLISLCTPKHRILRKGSKGKGITNDDESFIFNDDYTSKLKRVKIPLVSLKETSITTDTSTIGGASSNDPNGNNNTLIPKPVEEDRRHLVEASIVRIMKARKTMAHNDLISEVMKQLSVRFAPSPGFIKKRVESLIEREYLERSESDHRVYNYLA